MGKRVWGGQVGGGLFSCLDSVLTVACCIAYRWGVPGRKRVGGWPASGASAGQLKRSGHRPSAFYPPTHPPPPAATLCRDPWVLPAATDARRQASLVRARLSSDAGGASDHLATIRAFNQWKGSQAVSGSLWGKRRGGGRVCWRFGGGGCPWVWGSDLALCRSLHPPSCPLPTPSPPTYPRMLQRGADRGFCAHNFLSPATMNMIDGMRQQLLSGGWVE